MQIVAIRRRSALRLVFVLLAIASAILGPTSSLSARMAGHARPVRLEGYWGRKKTETAVIGEATISAAGHGRREFGITALQAYKPEEEGPQVFRQSSLRPVTLLLNGPKDMIERFIAARPDQKVTAFGLYRAGAGQLILSSVEVANAPGATPTP